MGTIIKWGSIIVLVVSAILLIGGNKDGKKLGGELIVGWLMAILTYVVVVFICMLL
jgi:hypothetical protein